MIPTILLAAADTAANPGDMNYITTGAIVAIASLITGLVTYNKGRQNRTVTIDGKPSVRIEDEFVRRTELAEFKQEIRTEVQRIERSVDKLGDIILVRDESLRRTIKETSEALSDKIEKVASGAFEGRRRIHETVNEHGKQIAAIGVNADVGKHIGKLGAAIMAHAKNCPVNQPTQPTHP
jgi:gas vesicle protein